MKKLLLILIFIALIFLAGCTSSKSSEEKTQVTEPTEIIIDNPKFQIGDIVHISDTDGFLITAHDNENQQYEVLTVTKFNDEWGFYSDNLYELHMYYKKDNDDFYYVLDHVEITDKNDALEKLPTHTIKETDRL